MVYASHKEYRKAWDNAENETPPVPINIDVEIASLCNLFCDFCFISDGSFDKEIRKPADDGKSKRRLMPKQLAFKIIDQSAEIGVPALKFNWRGEATIHPDYSEIIQYARNKEIILQERYVSTPGEITGKEVVSVPTFIELLVNTNANCKQHAIDGLMACTKVMISLDSMVLPTYLKMRRGGDLTLAKETIWKLVVRNHPNIWVRRVITKDNQNEDFFADVKKEWGDKVKVSEHSCFDRNSVSIHEVDNEHDYERRYCSYPSQRLIITSVGLAYPCCLDLKETMPVGDINKQSIIEIWNGEPMRKLRQDLKNNVFKSSACKNCQSWLAYKSPKRDFVQDREGIRIEKN